ncbi:MAG: hypothetical protein HY898_36160 [Deltaproteobacteria bacterium]|nr:hypothetical protein [Deltaproteobacteria bacterium]
MTRNWQSWPRELGRKAIGSPLASLLVLTAIAVCFYVVAYPFLVVRYPPITDLPFHGASTSIFRHYFDRSWHFREQFSFHLLQVPYWTQYTLGAVFALFMSIVSATKASAIVMLALLPAGLAVMFHGMRKSPLLGLLALPLVWNTLTHWGFLSFMGAIGLFAMVIGLTLMVLDRPTRQRQVALAVVLLLVYATHIFRFPFALAAVVGTTLMMLPATRRWKPVLLPLVPSLVALGVWLVVREKELSTQAMAPLKLHWDRLAQIDGFLFNGFVGPEERALAHRTYWVCAAVAAINFVSFFVERRWRGLKSRDAWWIVGSHVSVLCVTLVFFAMYLALPMEIGIWWYVYPREIVIAILIGIGLVPDLPKPSWAKVPALAAISFVTISQAFFVAKSFAAFDTATEDFDRIIQQIPKAPKLGYMVFDHQGSNRSTTPFIHLPAWVQATRGGWLSFHFVGWGANPIQYRKASADVPPPTPIRFEWMPEHFDVATRGKFFDWFLVRSVYSPEPRFKVDSTIRLVDHMGTWWLFHRESAPAKP